MTVLTTIVPGALGGPLLCASQLQNPARMMSRLTWSRARFDDALLPRKTLDERHECAQRLNVKLNDPTFPAKKTPTATARQNVSSFCTDGHASRRSTSEAQSIHVVTSSMESGSRVTLYQSGWKSPTLTLISLLTCGQRGGYAQLSDGRGSQTRAPHGVWSESELGLGLEVYRVRVRIRVRVRVRVRVGVRSGSGLGLDVLGEYHLLARLGHDRLEWNRIE